MRLFPKAARGAAVLGALVLGTALLFGVERGNATTVAYTPNGTDPGAVDLNTAITVPGAPAGGTLSFNLTLGANYSLGSFSGASGNFNMELDTQSTPFSSGAFLTAAPSTPGSTNYGDQTNSVLAKNITDTSLWTVNVLPGDFPVKLTINSSFSGFCDGPDACFPPNATFSYDFTANTATTPLPAALPLFAGGLATLGVLGWRRKRRT